MQNRTPTLNRGLHSAVQVQSQPPGRDLPAEGIEVVLGRVGEGYSQETVWGLGCLIGRPLGIQRKEVGGGAGAWELCSLGAWSGYQALLTRSWHT